MLNKKIDIDKNKIVVYNITTNDIMYSNRFTQRKAGERNSPAFRAVCPTSYAYFYPATCKYNTQLYLLRQKCKTILYTPFPSLHLPSW